MGIKKRWSQFTSGNVSRVPEAPGAYQLAYRYGEKKTAYIGSSKNLRRRLSEHLQDASKSKYRYFRYIEAGPFESPKDLEIELREEYEKKHAQKPKGSKKLPRRRRLFGW